MERKKWIVIYKYLTAKGHYGQYAGMMEGSMKTYEKIEMNPKIMFGKPVIKIFGHEGVRKARGFSSPLSKAGLTSVAQRHSGRLIV